MSGSTLLRSPRLPREVPFLCRSRFLRKVNDMDDNKFWAIVEECDVASGGDMDRKDQLIKAAISRLAGDEALAFYEIFHRMMDTAFAWSLWGAAYVLYVGCGEGCFIDFCGFLFSLCMV